MSARRVLVTGASKGIGRAIALRLGTEGWDVLVHYGTDKQGAEETLNALGERGAGVLQCDLEDPIAAFEMAEGLDFQALVNNAGVYIPNQFADSDPDEFAEAWRRTLRINVESPIGLMRAACEKWGSDGGRILNVCSRVGFKGESGAAFYAASKAALVNLTRSLAVELAPKNIRLHALAPGWVETAMVRDSVKERLPEILEGLPLGRMASVEDCAASAAFLLSDEAAYLSGQCIDINGASYFH